jgi:hypothetical protein
MNLLKTEYYRDFLSGTISGSIGVFIGHPCDTLKVKKFPFKKIFFLIKKIVQNAKKSTLQKYHFFFFSNCKK